VTAGGFSLDGDTLSAVTAGTSIVATGGTADAAGNVTLTLTGYDTVAHYQQVLRSITFNSGSNPTNFGDTNATRTITWHLDDGAAGDPHSTVNTKTTTLTITPTNNPPTLDLDSTIGGQ